MTREVTTTEALMTDPTTEEGRAYWQQRHDHEDRLERARELERLRDAADYEDWEFVTENGS